jgi:Calcineurin-like phosphoesterase
MPERVPDLVFVHLSDIHFRKGRVGDVHDVDADLRNEIEIDLRRLRGEFPQVNGIIISGDIAFGGQREEYLSGGSWIERIREQLGCSLDSVMITPGNHDIDRNLIVPGSDINNMHREIRAAPSAEEREAILRDILHDGAKGELLFHPLSNYNDFASRYGCGVNRGSPFWERDYRLADGTTLRFRGITTTLLSGPDDDDGANRMVYGAAQLRFLREPNVRWAVIGHHPPSWTLDPDSADRVFSVRTALQLFGHKHEHWITPLGKGIRLIAGAVHPERWESHWLPRYYVIAVSAVGSDRLGIRVYPRCWSDEEIMFKGDCDSSGRHYRDFLAEVDATQATTNES